MGKMTPLEVVKYIKFPDRRLISGFLTINMVSHSDNDGLDDANQEYQDGWGGGDGESETSHPFFSTEPDNPGRNGYKHSFGDYDCLLFWVAGGMTLHAPSFSSRMSQVELESGGFLSASSGPATWTDDTGSPNDAYDSNEHWFLSADVVHPCQHFLKSHLISRINNGYGHTNTDYYKIPGILTNQFEYNTNIEADWNNNVTAASSNAIPSNREGSNYRYILSNGVFSNDTDGDYVGGVAGASVEGSSGDLSNVSNNTYFPMIEGVEVYGKHKYTIPSHKNGLSGSNYIYSNTNTSVGNYAHEAGYWSMVIKIKIRAYHPTNTSGQATKEFFKSRTNVMFQPFGETASFDIGNSLHAS